MAYQLNDQDRQIAQQMAMGSINKRIQNQQPESSGNLFTNLLPTAGGILGGIGGSFLAPGLGTAAGGAAGAGLGKYLQNILEGKQDQGEGVLGEAALGTLGGIGKGIGAIKGATGALKAGQGISKAANVLRMGVPNAAKTVGSQVAGQTSKGLLNKAGQGLENVGGKLLGSQSLMTASQARNLKINPMEVFKNVNKRTGLSQLSDMGDVSKVLTGGKGSILDTATRATIGETSGVKLPNLGKFANDYIADFGTAIPDSARKRALTAVERAGESMYGGSKGSISQLANPQTVLDKANDFRQMAKGFTNKFTTTTADEQQGKLYNKLADALENSLYKSPGVKESLPTILKATTDDVAIKAQELRALGQNSQAKALENIIPELRKVKNVKELRSFKKDFVDISNIENVTGQAEGARGLSNANLSGKFNIMGILGSSAAPKVGGIATKAGRALQGGVNLPQASNAAKIAGTQLLGRSMTGSLPGSTQTTETSTMSGVAPTNSISGYGASTPTSILSGTGSNQSSTKSIYTKEAVAQDIQRDLAATGGENMDKYITLYNFLNPEIKASESSAYTRPSSQQYSMATGGAEGINQMQQMLAQDPSILSKTAIPGQDLPIIGGTISNLAGTGTYNTQAQNVLDSLARARTGAAMPASEKAFYERLLPRAGDSEATVQNKLATLRQSFEPFLNYGGSTSAEDILSALAR